MGTIFADHPNAIRLITPQNIADSADTSTKKMGLQDNVFDFIEYPAGSTSYTSQRNTFSPTYNIGLRNRAFNSADPYAFSYIINGPGPAAAGGGRIEHSRSFSPTETEGPPLDYLLKCNLDAAAGIDFRTTALPTTSLSLITGMSDAMMADIVGKTSRAEEALFLDIKRDGDQSQVDAAKIADAALKSVVMVTGDRLCSLASRLKAQRCIYQSKHVLKIYRFMPYAQDPARIEEYLAAQRAAEAARFLATYGDFAANINTAGFIDSLKAFNRQVFDAANAPVYSILKIKLKDMYDDICRFITAITPVISTVPFPPPAGDRVGYIRQVFRYLATAGIMKDFAVDISRTVAAGVGFNPTREYPFLNYSYKQINTLSTSFSSMVNKLITNRRPQRGPPTNWFDIVTAPDGYNTILENIRYGISDPTLLDIYSIKLNPAAAAVPGATTADLVAAELGRITALASPAALAINPACQSGGDPMAVIMNQNRIDLFHDICARAATYVDSVFTKRYPLLVLQSMLKQINKAVRDVPVAAAAAAGGDAAVPPDLFPVNTLIENTQQFIDANKKLAEDTLSGVLKEFYAKHAVPDANQTITDAVNKGGLTLLIAHVDAKAAEAYPPASVMSALLGALNANASTFQLIDELSVSWDQGKVEYGITDPGEIGQYKTPSIGQILDGEALGATAAAAVPPTLIMLAIVNDIIEGNVTSNTSLYSSVFIARGGLPANAAYSKWNDDKSWVALRDFFANGIATILNGGQISTAPFNLLGGGTRRRRRTIRKRGKSARRRRATARR